MVNRRIVVVRHGERVDFMFTDEWLESCFSEKGIYKKRNLNMPDTIPHREGSPKTFLRDCPLTQVGVLQAEMIGKGLLAENVLREGFDVYVSPALRSVQTAIGVGKGMGVDFTMHIEPCLFEWTGWFHDFMPAWMSVAEFSANGYNVDTSYKPFKNAEDIVACEEVRDFYDRTHRLVSHLLSRTDKDLLLVAHGASLDAATRQLSGEPVRTSSEMLKIVRDVPYCGVAVSEQSPVSKQWSVIPIPQLALRHSSVNDFCAAKTLSVEPILDAESSKNLHT